MSLSNFRVMYAYCGDVSSCVVIAENKDEAYNKFMLQQKSGTKVISISLA